MAKVLFGHAIAQGGHVLGGHGLTSGMPLPTGTSNDFSGYVASQMTVTPAAADSPFGASTATALTPSAISLAHRIYRTDLGLTNANVVFTIFGKANGYQQLAFRESGVTGAGAVFNISSGSLVGVHNAGTITISNTSVVTWPDGWFRLLVELTDSGSANKKPGIHVTSGWSSGDPITNTFAGDGVSNILVAGWSWGVGTI